MNITIHHKPFNGIGAIVDFTAARAGAANRQFANPYDAYVAYPVHLASLVADRYRGYSHDFVYTLPTRCRLSKRNNLQLPRGDVQLVAYYPGSPPGRASHDESISRAVVIGPTEARRRHAYSTATGVALNCHSGQGYTKFDRGVAVFVLCEALDISEQVQAIQRDLAMAEDLKQQHPARYPKHRGDLQAHGTQYHIVRDRNLPKDLTDYPPEAPPVMRVTRVIHEPY